MLFRSLHHHHVDCDYFFELCISFQKQTLITSARYIIDMGKILLIDDEQAIRKALKEILEYESFEVTEAEDGIAALKLVEKETYDLIFCDVKMPRMDGLEVLNKLKERAVETPVVIITGHGNIETAVESLKKGAYDFIQKPLDLNRILVTVRNACNQHSLQKEIGRAHV